MKYTPYGPGDEITWGPCTDPRDPRWEEDDDFISEEEAYDMAADEIIATPYHAVWWLMEHALTDDALKPVATEQVTDYLPEATLPQLVSLLMAGTERQVIDAAYELRERFINDKATQKTVAERAEEIMRDSQIEPPDAGDIGCEFDD